MRLVAVVYYSKQLRREFTMFRIVIPHNLL
jgi:hypothetical protein